MIVGVAVRNSVLTVMLPKPNRHHHCFEYIKELNLKHPKGDRIGGTTGDNQGFYTHTGKYLTREQAYKYAKRIKQPLIEGNNGKYLFSEDLW